MIFDKLLKQYTFTVYIPVGLKRVRNRHDKFIIIVIFCQNSLFCVKCIFLSYHLAAMLSCMIQNIVETLIDTVNNAR
jgi:hypothetical protein